MEKCLAKLLVSIDLKERERLQSFLQKRKRVALPLFFVLGSCGAGRGETYLSWTITNTFEILMGDLLPSLLDLEENLNEICRV